MAHAKSNARHESGRKILMVAAAVCFAASMAAAQTAPQARQHGSQKPRAAGKLVSAPTDAPAAPEPDTPKWPANEAPSRPTVTWNSEGLHIHATNASLSQILSDVSTQTGAKIEGIGKDERVFGDYGPGQAREVLAQLLHGSGYDFLMLGDQGQGTPRQVILSARQNHGGAAAAPGVNRPQQDQDDDAEFAPDADGGDDAPPEPQPIQPPQPPQPEQPNPQQPMTPQQRMQMMQQQRLQQMQQLQQQYQQQQQQQQQMPPDQPEPPEPPQ